MSNESNIIIYNTLDGKASVTLYAKDGSVWMNQTQLAELFDTSVPNISMHTSNILKEKELDADSVIKFYLTTASDGKQYNVAFYSLDMMEEHVSAIYAEFAERRKNFVPEDPKIKTGWLARYARLVTSANQGAVLK